MTEKAGRDPIAYFAELFAKARDSEPTEPNAMAVATVGDDGQPSVRMVLLKEFDEFDLRARMFAPLDGVPEDPATGSASCALAGLLGHHEAAASGTFSWRIAQGVEMGRPSVLQARAEKREGVVVTTRVGGACVLVGEGYIEVA